MTEALELLAWMVAQRLLEMRVGVPCDAKRRPIPAEGLFHEKSGIVEDKTGDKIAFNGSLNETAAGWTRNWENLNVFTSWGEPGRVIEEDENFGRLWANQAKQSLRWMYQLRRKKTSYGSCPPMMCPPDLSS